MTLHMLQNSVLEEEDHVTCIRQWCKYKYKYKYKCVCVCVCVCVRAPIGAVLDGGSLNWPLYIQ